MSWTDVDRVKTILLAGSLFLVGGWALEGTPALAKKNGTEVRNEPAPTGRGPDIDDRRARSGRDDSDKGHGSSSGKGSGNSKHGDDDDSSGSGSSGSLRSSGPSGGQDRGEPRGRVVIRDDDRF